MNVESGANASPAVGEQPHLLRRLGLLNAVSINMSNMVGTGPFITVPAILATMGGPQALVSWFVGDFSAIRYAGRAAGALLLPLAVSHVGKRGRLAIGLTSLALTTAGQALIQPASHVLYCLAIQS